MIAALGEGITQSLLPCSWSLLLPAVALGVSSRRARTYGAFTASLIVTAWMVAAGWLHAPLWFAGVFLLTGAVWWWKAGVTAVPTAMVGMGSAWAWRPCVGPELGEALTTLQTDPVGGFVGLAGFLIGVVAVGLAVGLGIGHVVRRQGNVASRVGAIAVGVLGASMLMGLYSGLASTFARWSTDLWA